jgi:hypothetical protein
MKGEDMNKKALWAMTALFAVSTLIPAACGGNGGGNVVGVTDVTSGLTAQYTCDGNVNDSIGSANGTASGGFSYVADRHGNANSACNFDGVDGKVHVSSSISAPASTGFSISFWVNNGASSFTGSIIYGNFLFSMNGPDGFTILPGATNTAFVSFPQGTWTHIVGTYDDTTQSIKTYKDGVFVQEAIKGSTAGGLSLTSLDFGQNAWPAAAYFSGALDDVRLYGRVLSASEVGQLYDIQK